jgi:large subunit ribosomal protein L2
MKFPVKNKLKRLNRGYRFGSGRNSFGRITVRGRGGAVKKRYKIVDYYRDLDNVLGRIIRIEKDTVRSSLVGLVSYENGFLAYILLPENVSVGDCIKSGVSMTLSPGDSMFLRDVPIGSFVHNIELYPGKGGVVCRAAGNSAQLLRKKGRLVLLRLSSGELRLFLYNCRATLGSVGNSLHKFSVIGKAGASRRLGIRPIVRGVAKNPVDHPHGGGQGKTKGGRCSVTPWGRLTKGKKTVDSSAKKRSRFVLKRRDEI